MKKVFGILALSAFLFTAGMNAQTTTAPVKKAVTAKTVMTPAKKEVKMAAEPAAMKAENKAVKKTKKIKRIKAATATK